MDSLETLPQDILTKLFDNFLDDHYISHFILYCTSKILRRIVSKYVIQKQIPRTLECHQIASKGYLNVLKWAVDSGYPVDNSQVCSEAALHGHFEVLEWVCSEGYLWDSQTTTNATKGGHFHILKWTVERGCPVDCNTSLVAAEFGHLEILKWIEQQRKFRCHPSYGSELAATNGHIHIIQYLGQNNGIDYTWRTYQVAALKGYENIIKFLIKTDRTLSKIIPNANDHHNEEMACVCSGAARGGHLNILQLLRETGFYWDNRTCLLATKNDHLHILKWARANGCEWDLATELMAKEKWGDIF
jgi:hypothetical protein